MCDDTGEKVVSVSTCVKSSHHVALFLSLVSVATTILWHTHGSVLLVCSFASGDIDIKCYYKCLKS